MWAAALGGIVLWFFTRPKRRLNNPVQHHRRWHVSLGGIFAGGDVAILSNRVDWSQWAGGNVDRLRAAFGWMTPQVNTQLHGMAMIGDPHAEHHSHHDGMEMPDMQLDWVQFDEVLQSAQQAGISATKLEIRPPRSADKALDGKRNRSSLAHAG